MNDAPAFRRIELGPWRLHVACEHEEAVLALDLGRLHTLEELADRAESHVMGRGTNAILRLPGTRSRIHLRPIRHGGLLADLTGRRLIGLGRPLAELSATRQLRQHGAPVPAPVLVLGRRVGLFWEAAVGSLHEENTLDGVSFLSRRPSRKRLLRAARAAGHAIRALHDAGGRHADLHIKNLLIREAPARAEVIVVDLDRARVGAPPSPERRMHELMRLARSLQKRGLLEALHPRARAAIFSAYLDGDRELRRRMQERASLERIRVAGHALFYPKKRGTLA